METYGRFQCRLLSPKVTLTSSPSGDGNSQRNWIFNGWRLNVTLTSSPSGDGNLPEGLQLRVQNHQPLHLPLPRQGMETRLGRELRPHLLELHLPLPRQGMETIIRSKSSKSSSPLHLPLPRQGMETSNSSTFFLPRVSLLHLPLPRQGMETHDKDCKVKTCLSRSYTYLFPVRGWKL